MYKYQIWLNFQYRNVAINKSLFTRSFFIFPFQVQQNSLLMRNQLTDKLRILHFLYNCIWKHIKKVPTSRPSPHSDLL